MSAGLLRADAVIVGGGLAGLWAALYLPKTWDVLVVDKGRGPELGSSPWAQGGMAAACGAEDSPALHARDTVKAGAGACREEAVQLLVDEARVDIDALLALGCAFDRDEDGSLDLNREGGQSVARSVHAADATGREIMRVVVQAARARAQRLMGSATSLIVAEGRCAGVRVETPQGDVDVLARGTLLAAGGCGALFDATTNPDAATGDAVALAWTAGVELADLEFVQFHPTALATGGLRRVLLTEALRGDGAIIVDEAGERFLVDVHPDAELGPRDVVARAIAERGGAYLDARPIGARHIRERFPNVSAAAEEAGFDLTAGPVPIFPAAHYFLGGVATDVWGRTSMPALYAAGECAATGVHGANRMAGNSLTESVVFGRHAAVAMADDAPDEPPLPDDEPDETSVRAFRSEDWDRLRSGMSAGAGLTRDEASLRKTQDAMEEIATASSGALQRAAVAASLICRSALLRTESRGVHYRSDAPQRDPNWDGRHVTLRSAGGPGE